MFNNILLMLGHKDVPSQKLVEFLKKKTKKINISYASSIIKKKFFNVKN